MPMTEWLWNPSAYVIMTMPAMAKIAATICTEREGERQNISDGRHAARSGVIKTPDPFPAVLEHSRHTWLLLCSSAQKSQASKHYKGFLNGVITVQWLFCSVWMFIYSHTCKRWFSDSNASSAGWAGSTVNAWLSDIDFRYAAIMLTNACMFHSLCVSACDHTSEGDITYKHCPAECIKEVSGR